jgi:hypothetical protein
MRGNYELSIAQPHRSRERMPTDMLPCAYLRRLLAELRRNKDLTSRINVLKSRVESFTSDTGVWLFDEEVGLALASVTLAIATIQDMEGGFSTLSSGHVDLGAFDDEHPYDIEEPVIRFGRPMVFSITRTWGADPDGDNDGGSDDISAHTVLVVIQMLEDESPEIAVVDSKAGYWAAKQRDTIFRTAMNVVRDSRWWRNIFPTYGHVALPERATWIPCAQQPRGSECVATSA